MRTSTSDSDSDSNKNQYPSLLLHPLVTTTDIHHSNSIPTKRTGTTWTAGAHIITGVIGSGVLSLPWSIAQLGWILGPLCILFFAVITVASAFLTADCYRFPDPESGPLRNTSYVKAVTLILGKKQAWLCGLLVQISYYGSAVAYTITSALCFSAIQRSNCYHYNGHAAPCENDDKTYMLIFGILQIFVSQIPNFHSMEWLSSVAAVMSFSYASIGLGLGASKAIGDGVIKGSITGVMDSPGSQKLWLVSQAVGDIAFAYPFSVLVLAIQDTLKSPPPENRTMKRASVISIALTTFYYLGCGGFGYAAFGDQTPGNILTGFGFYEPYWLIDFANACIVLHLVGGYQVYSQPLFAAAENWMGEHFPDNSFVTKTYILKLPLLPDLKISLQRVCFRTAYVASGTAIAVIFPFFNEVLGILGALSFWPLAIYFPVEMCLRRKGIEAWTTEWLVLRGFSFGCFVIALFAFVGSVEGVIAALFGPVK
ncbi:probable amino acid permease 7 [Andrographis paniculata]|uniref:probable amino acid permease 7 n=1 Tax=Andrographis paniculata TaxID=175694 RepID=UPI0021E78DF4|nr:probable amino acid permease 7 [Andrographis paniculata]